MRISLLRFFKTITKMPVANNWRRKKIPSCSYSALVLSFMFLVSVDPMDSSIDLFKYLFIL